MALLAVAVVVAAAIVLFTRRDQSGDLAAALERVVDTGAPGALVVVQIGDDVERQVAPRAATPMTPDLRFRVGSITKTFVPPWCSRWSTDGLIRLDNPVERWLPGVVPGGDTITVRHLLNAHVGVARLR